VSLAPKITPERARIDWQQPAMAIDRLIRAATPRPGAWTDLAGARLKLGPLASATAAADPGPPPGPGELRLSRSRVLVGTGSDPVELGDVQPHGKRPMRAADWARGLRGLAPAAARLT
jgi:methionyl-tRNA formyltransferase